MDIKKLSVLLFLGITLNTTSQAGVVIKGNDGSTEKIQGALLGLQTKATLLGFAKNEYDLGMAYYEGKIVERDPQKAAEWLLKASKKNYAPAMFVYGGMLLTGDGTQRNIQLGSQLINAAAAKGDKQALALIEESKKQKLPEKSTNQISQNQNANDGMCSYQDYYMQSLGDIEYAKRHGKVAIDTEDYVKGPCKINVVYGQNNRVEIYTNFRANNKNYDLYAVTKLKDSCGYDQCMMAINANQPINKAELMPYDRIEQYDLKDNQLSRSSDEDPNSLNEKIKQNQSYCFEAAAAHSATKFCMNLGGKTVHQDERAVEN